jgi:hypothetical protein
VIHDRILPDFITGIVRNRLFDDLPRLRELRVASISRPVVEEGP